MNVLIVGGGGREHAIVWSLSQSPRVDTIYCAPGNAGISKLARCLPVDVEDFDGIADAVREHGIGLAVIGPEVPLANGITDALEASGTKVFGPNKKCARLEASKAFTKEFLERHGIPTAKHKVFADKEDLLEAIGIFGFPMVLKADGLAAGKGVVIAKTAEEAKIAIEQMMCERIFGEAGDKVVVEEFLSGVEASVLCFVDEKTIVPMESAQDYKRVYDNDEGPNTGGMGAYSPSLLFDGALEKRVMDEILAPTLKGLKADGLDYKGVLYAGLMITDEGPKVIEFNVRFGDPETQAVLPRLKTDLLDIFLAVTENTLADVDIKWSSQKTVCVVMASGGYPGSYEKGFVIEGLDNVDNDVWVFHAGTALSQSCGGSSCGAAAVTAGGRVLGVAAADDSHEAAREKAYKNVAKIFFEG
ncbi:MAG: phosphoribosylamine--glycine ligase, partial [Clostridiales bacterium]|nr:phosphoribosylamine--glycine ligase [Clostridiales bacterium]